jgi:cytochrome b6-f complex iron-sulfur subunit
MTTKTSDQNTPTDTTMSRRDFLKWAWLGLGGLAVLEAGGLGLRFFAPRIGEGEFGGLITAGSVDDFPPGSVTPFNEGRFYLVRLADGGFLALYRKCTHLGCTVEWQASSQTFFCPCHASAFENDGAVINPPAPRPLDLFPVSFAEGQVQVDTGSPQQRDHFLPEQVSYLA